MEFTLSLLFAYTKQKLNLNLDKYYAYNWNCPCFLFNVIKIYRKWKWHLGFYWEIESGLIWKLELTSQFVAYFKISNSRKFMGHHSAARLYFHAKIGAKLSEKNLLCHKFLDPNFGCHTFLWFWISKCTRFQGYYYFCLKGMYWY